MTERNEDFILEQGFPLPLEFDLVEIGSGGTESAYSSGDFTNWRGMFVIADLQNNPVIVTTTTTAPAGLAAKFTDIAVTGLTLNDTTSQATLTITASQANKTPGPYSFGLYLYNASGEGQVFARGACQIVKHAGY